MGKKGFTLIELLAILVVLGVITLVAVPSALNSSREAKEKDIEKFKESVCHAAEIYIETHSDDYGTIKAIPGTTVTIDVSTLIDEGVLSASTVDPRTNKAIDDFDNDNQKIKVKVTNVDNELIYELQE